jgi:hypothetical protein
MVYTQKGAQFKHGIVILIYSVRLLIEINSQLFTCISVILLLIVYHVKTDIFVSRDSRGGVYSYILYLKIIKLTSKLF